MGASMSPVDLVGLIGSSVACATLLMRRNMLRHGFKTWHSASWVVQAALALLAIFMGMVAVSIFCGWRPNPRESFAYAVLGAVAFVLLVNLDQSGRTGGRDEA